MFDWAARVLFQHPHRTALIYPRLAKRTGMLLTKRYTWRRYFNMDCVGDDCDLIAEAWNVKECNPSTNSNVCNVNGRGVTTSRAGRLPCTAVNNNVATEDGRLGLLGSILWGDVLTAASPLSTDPCSNANTTWNLIRNVANRLSGVPTISLDTPTTGICEPIWEINGVSSDALEVWADGTSTRLLNRYGRPIAFLTNSSLPTEGSGASLKGAMPAMEFHTPSYIVGLRDIHPFGPVGTGGCRGGFSAQVSSESATTAAFRAAQVAARAANGGFALPGGAAVDPTTAGLVVNSNGCTANCAYDPNAVSTSTTVTPAQVAAVNGAVNPTAAQQQQQSSPNAVPGSSSVVASIDQQNSASSDSASGLGGGVVAAIVICVLLLFVVAVGAAFYLGKRESATATAGGKPGSSTQAPELFTNSAYEESDTDAISSITKDDIGKRVNAEGYNGPGTIRYVGYVGPT